MLVHSSELDSSNTKSWSHLGPGQGLGEEDEDGKVEEEDEIEEELINFCTDRQEPRICHHQCHI